MTNARKKIRGLKRKSRNLENRIISYTEFFPEEEDRYWHLHLPCRSNLIDSIKTPFSLRRSIIQLLIDRTNHLINSRSEELELGYAHVLLALNFPNLWNSQIIVFYDQEYFRNFFDRNSPSQLWTKLPSTRDIIREWKLNLPPSLDVVGYKEDISDEEFEYSGELWFIGELD